MQRFGCSVPLGPALDFGIDIFFLITSHTQWCDAGGEQTKLCHSSDLCSLSLDNCSWTPFSIHSAWSWSHVTNFCPVGVAAVSVLPSRPPAPSSRALSVVGYLDNLKNIPYFFLFSNYFGFSFYGMNALRTKL